MAPIKKDQEFFAPYGYTMDFAPKWYRELYKQFVKDNPTKTNEVQIKVIKYIDEKLAKGDIPMWGETLDKIFKEFGEQTNLPRQDE